MGTAERRLEILKYLCQRRHATMQELAEEFGVSIRTVQRDIYEIEATFHAPIIVKSGRYEGGVYVMEDYKWDKAYMSAEDIALLIKIRKIGANKETLTLDGDELQRLERIIVTYSIPGGK